MQVLSGAEWINLPPNATWMKINARDTIYSTAAGGLKTLQVKKPHSDESTVFTPRIPTLVTDNVLLYVKSSWPGAAVNLSLQQWHQDIQHRRPQMEQMICAFICFGEMRRTLEHAGLPPTGVQGHVWCLIATYWAWGSLSNICRTQMLAREKNVAMLTPDN